VFQVVDPPPCVCTSYSHARTLGPSFLFFPVFLPTTNTLQLLWVIVIDHFEYPRETVTTCMSFLDRYMWSILLEQQENHGNHEGFMSKRDYQLLFSTCLYIAMKMTCSDSYLPIESMSFLCRNVFSTEAIMATERAVLKRLDWKLWSPPTSHVFLEHYTWLLASLVLRQGSDDKKAAEAALAVERFEQVVEDARYSLELATLDAHFVAQRPSCAALASLLNALAMIWDKDDTDETNNDCNKWGQQLVQALKTLDLWPASGADGDAIARCQERLHDLRGNVYNEEEDLEGNNTDPGVDDYYSHPAQADIHDEALGRGVSPVSVTHPHLF